MRGFWDATTSWLAVLIVVVLLALGGLIVWAVRHPDPPGTTYDNCIYVVVGNVAVPACDAHHPTPPSGGN